MLDNKMAVQNTALLVFLFPVVISVAFGALVLSGALVQPNRELDMWPFDNTRPPIQTGSQDIVIQGLSREYAVNTPVEVRISINNSDFDCGDLYVTIYDDSKEVMAQNGFFSQCFLEENLTLPIDDSFSEKINKQGEYEIVAEMSDKNYEKTITTSAKFKIR